MMMKKLKKFLCVTGLAVCMALSMTACSTAGEDDGAVSLESLEELEEEAEEKAEGSEEEVATEDEDFSEDGLSTEMTDTIRWFNATYAILTELNGFDTEYFGGMATNDMNAMISQASLEESWGVTDRATADETMEWLLTEGHRTGFKDNMADLADAGIDSVEADGRADFIYNTYEVGESEAQFLADMYGYYEEYGESAIDAWDYCRAMSLAAFYYHAGYYTETEALNKSMEIAEMIQPLYTSWDEAMNSYLLGYEYWAEESSDERREIYEDLKQEDDSLYNIDWNLAFEKTWEQTFHKTETKNLQV